MCVADMLSPGDKYGFFTVLGFAGVRRPTHRGKSRAYVGLVCNCGNICVKPAYKVFHGGVKSCGCLHRLAGGKLQEKTKGVGTMPGWYISHLKSAANKRHIEFGITAEYADALLRAQGSRCALTDIEIYTSERRGVMNASLDRIDSEKGYIEGNVQWVHKWINKMKLHHKTKDFIELCTLVAFKAGTLRHAYD